METTEHLAIWGFGREGHSAFNFLRTKHRINRTTIIGAEPPTDLPEDAAFVAEATLADWVVENAIDVLVKSPGVSLHTDLFRHVASNAKCVTSATNIWMEQHPNARTVMVTGTKGKSTTTSLMQFMATALGLQSQLMGNIGTPLLDCEPAKDLNIIELSSYQAADLQVSPSLFVVTNLFSDHLVWHGSQAQYEADKLRPARLQPVPPTLCHAAMKQRLPAGARCLHPGSLEHVDNELLFKGHRQTVRLKNFPLKGEHNRANLNFAISALDVLGFELPDQIDFSTFETLPHRLQEVRLPDGLLLVDDSISTTPFSVLQATAIYPLQKTHLFIGGFDRGIDYSSLQDAGLEAAASINLFGPVGERLLADGIFKSDARMFNHHSLLALQRKRLPNMKDNEIALLSPGAPSFDEFKDFADRGTQFIEAARQIRARASRTV